MKIIIFGNTSFTGIALKKHFERFLDYEIFLVGRTKNQDKNFFYFEPSKIQENNKLSLKNIFDKIGVDKKTILINLISEGNIDLCESDPERSKFLNVDFVKILYSAIEPYKFKKFIHFSTNAVYDGYNPPYSETTIAKPINVYGNHKLEIDKYLLSYNDNRIIILRPTTMYGDISKGGRSNPVGMIIKNLLEKKPIKLVNDLIVNILYVEDLCEILHKVVESDFYGLINVAGPESFSRYELGLEIALILELNDSLISECSMSDFPSSADRPLNTTFDITLMKSFLKSEPSNIKNVLETKNYKSFF